MVNVLSYLYPDWWFCPACGHEWSGIALPRQEVEHPALCTCPQCWDFENARSKRPEVEKP